MVLCALVAAILLELSEGIVRAASLAAVDRLSIPQYLLLVSIVVAMTVVIVRGRPGLANARNAVFYPPMWIAVPLALAVWVTMEALSGRGSTWSSRWDGAHDLVLCLSTIPLFAWLIALTPLLAAVTYCVTYEREVPPSRSDESAAGTTLPVDFSSILAWVADDREIRTPADDRFAHAPFAALLAARIRDRSKASHALIGPRGSGKSSIACFVEFELGRSSQFVIARISLWPFDSAEAAVRGVLQRIIQQLGSRIDCLALTGLPEQYVSAIERTPGQWGILGRLLRGNSEPRQMIDGIEESLLATDLRLVVWIEDLERFARSDSTDSEARDESRNPSAIQALLHLLDDREQITVVIADTAIRRGFDIGEGGAAC